MWDNTQHNILWGVIHYHALVELDQAISDVEFYLCLTILGQLPLLPIVEIYNTNLLYDIEHHCTFTRRVKLALSIAKGVVALASIIEILGKLHPWQLYVLEVHCAMAEDLTLGLLLDGECYWPSQDGLVCVLYDEEPGYFIYQQRNLKF